MSDAFLSLLCTHCAPTLSGVKPACIFTLHKENIPGWQTELSSCRSLFSGNGLRLRVLCGCRRHLVIMVYRPALLRESLRQPERRAFLQACGYPVSMGTGRLLDELSRRMRSAKAGGFPHEIGDVEQAQHLFRRYAACRKRYLAMASSGLTLGEMLAAG